MKIKLPESYALGQPKVRQFSKTQFAKISEIINALNDLTDGTTSFEDLTVTNTLTVGGATTIAGALVLASDLVTENLKLQGLLYLKETPQTLTGAGAVNITSKITLLVTTGANALTLGAGADGQIKIISMKTDGGDGILTPTGLRGGTTITFNAVGQSATLMYKDSAWLPIALVGAVLA